MRKNKASTGLILLLIVFFLSSCQQNVPAVIAFTHVNVIPMTMDEVIHDQTILVSGAEIIALGDADELPIPTVAVEDIPTSAKFLRPAV